MENKLQIQPQQQQFSLVPRDFREALEFGKLMASSDMVPKDYRNKPANVLVAVQMGQSLGLDPMQSIQNIAIINGRPCLWGDAMLAVVKGHRDCKYVHEAFEQNENRATCTVSRRGSPDVVRSFSEQDARTAGLWGKDGPWTTYPSRMLQLRARSFALRDAFPDALRGISQAEEQRDIVDARTGTRSERPAVVVESAVVPAAPTAPEPEPVARVPEPNHEQAIASAATAAEVSELSALVESAASLADITAIKTRLLALRDGGTVDGLAVWRRAIERSTELSEPEGSA